MMTSYLRLSIGVDFGTESCRIVFLDIDTGKTIVSVTSAYRHGVIDTVLPELSDAPITTTDQYAPPSSSLPIHLPSETALQNPLDWFTSLREGMDKAHAVLFLYLKDLSSTMSPTLTEIEFIGIGIAFTSCTMLPCTRYGVPLCYVSPEYARNYNSWPKLWKDHRAQKEATYLTNTAKELNEPWLKNYGNSIGLEWLLPKILETKNSEERKQQQKMTTKESVSSSNLLQDIDIWIEGGDFMVWHLVSGSSPVSPSELTVSSLATTRWRPWSSSFTVCSVDDIVRSTCQAGYKGCWTLPSSSLNPVSTTDTTDTQGYPSKQYLETTKLFSEFLKFSTGDKRAPGTIAGTLNPYAASLLRLPSSLPVSTSIIDAHAGVLGVGVTEPGTLVLVLGTSGCYMLMNETKILIPGVAGIVENGILPSYVGYETGQSSVGDALAWISNVTSLSHTELIHQATLIDPGSNGVLATDWFLGARTPLMNGNLSGSFLGLTTTTTPGQLYRATMESIGYGIKSISELFIQKGVQIKSYVASGGLPHHNPLFVSIIANILNAPIRITTETQPVALGAALLGVKCANQYTKQVQPPPPQQNGGSSPSSVPLTRSSLPLPDFKTVNERCVAVSSVASSSSTPGSSSSRGSTVLPNVDHVQVYQKLYPLYQKLVHNQEFLHLMEELRQYSMSGHASSTITKE